LLIFDRSLIVPQADFRLGRYLRTQTPGNGTPGVRLRTTCESETERLWAMKHPAPAPVHSDATQAAVAEFPELAHLADLVSGGWVFVPVLTDGQLSAVQGARIWPTYWADVIDVRYTTDAQALRADPDGHVVWKHEGTLVDVVQALLELPAPDAVPAPRLAIGAAPRLWAPHAGD
jgi:hypothetical protein